MGRRGRGREVFRTDGHGLVARLSQELARPVSTPLPEVSTSERREPAPSSVFIGRLVLGGSELAQRWGELAAQVGVNFKPALVPLLHYKLYVPGDRGIYNYLRADLRGTLNTHTQEPGTVTVQLDALSQIVASHLRHAAEEVPLQVGPDSLWTQESGVHKVRIGIEPQDPAQLAAEWSYLRPTLLGPAALALVAPYYLERYNLVCQSRASNLQKSAAQRWQQMSGCPWGH